MKLEAGMRVRCVDAGSNSGITNGIEYRVLDPRRETVPGLVRVTGGTLPATGATYYANRFKPIVRVKAPSRKGCNGCEDFAFRARLHRFATSGELA